MRFQHTDSDEDTLSPEEGTKPTEVNLEKHVKISVLVMLTTLVQCDAQDSFRTETSSDGTDILQCSGRSWHCSQ